MFIADKFLTQVAFTQKEKGKENIYINERITCKGEPEKERKGKRERESQ